MLFISVFFLVPFYWTTTFSLSYFNFNITRTRDKNIQTASHTIKGTFTSSKIAYKTQVIWFKTPNKRNNIDDVPWNGKN